jgi:ubiquitin-conjugating enzyme E2 D/E
MISQRIKTDFEHLKSEYNKKSTSDHVCFELLEDNWKNATKEGSSLGNKRDFNLLIKGPDGSPYQGGLFEINIKLEGSYPMKPPKITFLSEIYHPNIRGSSICLSTLKDVSWSPALILTKVLMSLQALLADPNPDDPLDPDSANDFKFSKEVFNQKAESATQRALEKVNAKRASLTQSSI